MTSPLKNVVVVPHTHWDREWYQEEHLLLLRLVDTVDRVLGVLESNATYSVFLLDGQTGLVDDYLAVCPQDEQRIKSLTGAGRLLLGPWFVLADEFLLTDECLTRNLMMGRLSGERYGGLLQVGYCPDSFGHPANLPAILNGFGIQHAILWRGYGGRPGEDSDLFRWNSADGSSLVVYHLAPDGYELGAELPVNRDAATKRWKQLKNVLEARSVSGHVLLPNGADHHGIQPDLPEALKTLRQIAPDLEFKVASPLTFFEGIPRKTLGTLAPVTGELRFSYGYTWTLQGIHSTRSRIKRSAANAEQMLVRWCEPQCALAFIGTGTDRRASVHHTWREFLRSCAHDSIGGCCTDAVAVDVKQRFERAGSAAQSLYVEAVWDRLNQDRTTVRRNPERWLPRLVVVNPSPQARADVIEATVTFFRSDVPVGRPGAEEVDAKPRSDKTFCLEAPNGKRIPVQVTECFVGYERLDGPRDYPDQDVVDAYRVVFPAEVPAFGIRSYRVVEHKINEPHVVGRSSDVVFFADGKLINRQLAISAGRRAFEVRSDGRRLSRVADIASEIDQGDTYTFQPADNAATLSARWGPSRVIWDGPVVGCVARDFRIGTRVEGTVYGRIERESNIVRWIVEGVNRAGNHRVRLLFPLPGTVDDVVVDQHFGPVVRTRETAHPADFPSEHPVRSAPCHRYVSMRGTSGGLTVFPRGVFEYELMESHVALTLFRAVGELSKANLAARPGHAGWPSTTPAAQELGPFRVELGMAMFGVSANATTDEWNILENGAETFHAPLSGVMMRHAIEPPDEVLGPSLEGAGLVFKSLKPAVFQDAVVFRCVNVTDVAVHGRVEWPMPLARAARCRLDETVQADLPLQDRKCVTFTASPHEIVSLILWPIE